MGEKAEKCTQMKIQYNGVCSVLGVHRVKSITPYRRDFELRWETQMKHLSLLRRGDRFQVACITRRSAKQVV